MTRVFYNILEISAAVSAVILIVLILSNWLNKKFTAKWRCWVWLILAVRLLIPFNYHVPEPPVNVAVPESTVTVHMPAQRSRSQVPARSAPEKITEQHAGEEDTAVQQEYENSGRTFSVGEIAAVAWALGAAAFMAYQLTKYFVFRKNIMRWSRPEEDAACRAAFSFAVRDMNIRGGIQLRRSKKISSPMMTGFFRPILFLPEAEYAGGELKMILRHELVHYKRRDIWYKFVITAANAVHWFNPVVWLMPREAAKDIEFVCDAEVTKGMDGADRKLYGEAILSAVSKGERCKTAFSTYFYGGKKTMKERIAKIFDTKKKRRGIAALCAVAAAAAVFGLFVAYGTKAPRVKVTIESTKAYLNVEGTDKAVEDSLFVPVIEKTKVDAIPYAAEGSEVRLSFSGKKPDKVAVTDVLINSTGKYKYSKNIKPENLNIDEKGGAYSFTVKKNVASYLSSDSRANDIYGYCITAKYGEKSYFYPFVLKIRSDNDTKVIKYDRFEVSVPKAWQMSENILKNNGKMCSFEVMNYDPSEPFSQLYGNHVEELSKKQLTGFTYPTTMVTLRRTQPAAADDTSYTDELNFFIIPDNSNVAYLINFNSDKVKESEALKIVKSFTILHSEIIDDVSAGIVKDNSDINITNEFVSYDYNYIALFGSLKNDKKQGAAVVYPVEKPANKKQVLTQDKHGSVKAVQTGKRTSTVNVTADDGYGWVFNVFNGFTGGHKSGEKFTSVEVAHNRILNDNDFYNLNYQGFIPEIDYASDSRVVFHGYFGLFVYDIQKQNITQSLNLDEIGCGNIQGSEYTSVFVSKDGKTVYMDSGGNDTDDYMYQYDIDSDSLKQVPYREMNDYYKKRGSIEKVLPGRTENTGGMYAELDNDRLIYFDDGGDSLTRNLRLVVYNKKSKSEETAYKVFKNWPRVNTSAKKEASWEEVSPAYRVKASVQKVNAKNGKLVSLTVKMTDDLPQNKDNTEVSYEYYTYCGKEIEIYFEDMDFSGELQSKVKKGKQIIITFAQFEKPNDGQVFDAALAKWLFYQDENNRYKNTEGGTLDLSSLETETKYFAYLSGLNVKTNTLTADLAEWITSDETGRMKELDLNKDDDMPSGFYIYNPKVDKKTFKLNTKAGFYIYDTNTQKTDENGMKKRIDEKKGKGAFWLTVKNGEVVKAEEEYIP